MLSKNPNSAKLKSDSNIFYFLMFFSNICNIFNTSKTCNICNNCSYHMISFLLLVSGKTLGRCAAIISLTFLSSLETPKYFYDFICFREDNCIFLNYCCYFYSIYGMNFNVLQLFSYFGLGRLLFNVASFSGTFITSISFYPFTVIYSDLLLKHKIFGNYNSLFT